MSNLRGGRPRVTGPRSHPEWVWKLGNPAAAGLVLSSALENGYSPWLSSMAYRLPGTGASDMDRRVMMVETADAVAPDLLIRFLTADPNQLELQYGSTPGAAIALAEVLVDPSSPLHEPASIAWARAMHLLGAIDPLVTLAVEDAVQGNAYPLISRYNDVQPFARLSIEYSTGREM